MCRNIRPLFNYDPPATEAEIHNAALQYVRKVSGFHAPSSANAEAFDAAVDRIASATAELLGGLSTSAPPRNREADAAKAHERAVRRFATGASR